MARLLPFEPRGKRRGGDVAAVRYTAIRWAREIPTLLHRGRVDRLGHHLVLLMATYAKNDGSDMYASAASLAKDARASERDVAEALDRLENAGLIARAHASNGAPGWSLNLSVRLESDGVAEDRLERRRAADRVRQQRRRDRQKSNRHGQLDRDGHGELARDVTPNSSVTSVSVTQELPVSHAELGRDNPDVTQELPVSHASMTVTTAGQTGCNSLINSLKDELPNELPPAVGANSADDPALWAVHRAPKPTREAPRSDYTADFEAFWSAYGKKGKKAAAAIEWHKAVKRADRTLIMTNVGPYVASKPELKWRLDAERWLKNDCWESAVVPARAVSGHQPYRDHDDDAAYDEGWGTA